MIGKQLSDIDYRVVLCYDASLVLIDIHLHRLFHESETNYSHLSVSRFPDYYNPSINIYLFLCNSADRHQTIYREDVDGCNKTS